MISFFTIFICFCCCAIPNISDNAYRNRELHTLDPYIVESLSSHTIENREDWKVLFEDRGGSWLVLLKNFCALPDDITLARLRQRIVLFGPLYSYHHLNFGAFTESRVPSFSQMFEAHLSMKLKRCEVEKTLYDVRALLDAEVVLQWYVTQEISLFHSKIRPYPIGFGYVNYRATDEVEMPMEDYKMRMLHVLDEAPAERQLLVLASFSKRTELYNKNLAEDPRAAALEALVGNASFGIKHVTKFTNDADWLSALASAKFIMSPSGWGPDCHRHYEAIAMGCVPIVIENYAVSQLLESMPVLMLQSWSDLTRGGPAYLERQYEKIQKKSYNLDKLFADYWRMKIRNQHK